MPKITRLSEFQYEISIFTIHKDFDGFYAQFLKTDLGKIYLSTPFSALGQTFQLKDSKKGTHCYFSPKGKIALMMLKNYYGCSDKKLMELSKGLNIRKSQEILAKSWIPYMRDLDKMFTDATCYESELRFPTNQKLLWECVQWNYKQMESLCRILKIKLPRTKYLDWCRRYNEYSKKKKKQSKYRTKVTRGLLKLLYKLNGELNKIENQNSFKVTAKYKQQRTIITKVYQQQTQIFKTGKSVPERIVSISKSYIRPIVRGKEVKQVEFGAKVNKIQIDGINFIEHIQYRAFNEGTRLQSSVFCAQNLTKTKIKMLGADAI